MKENNPVLCLVVDDEPMACEILTLHLSQMKNINIVATCNSAMEAFHYINHHPIDLVFLDINMPDISGISFARSINKKIRIIFTTAYRDYAVEGFELRAVDYLLKPISFDRLLQAVNAYFEVSGKTTLSAPKALPEKQSFIFIRSNRKMVRVDFDHILYIESLSDYLKIRTKTGETLVTRETIKQMEEKLPSNQFMRTHRSFIVSLQHISSFTNEFITIATAVIPISRSYKQDVLQQLERYE